VIVHPTNLCTVPCLARLQPTILCTLPTDMTTNYPLRSFWRYSNRVSCMCSTLSGDTTTDYPLCSGCQYYNRLSTLLWLLILQLALRSTLPVDITTAYLLCSLWRYYKRLCYAVHSTLSSDTTTDSPLCFACRNTNRLSAALLYLSILQLTIHCTDYTFFSLWCYSNRLSNLSTIRSDVSCVSRL
jgi:hypothetical protein